MAPMAPRLQFGAIGVLSLHMGKEKHAKFLRHLGKWRIPLSRELTIENVSRGSWDVRTIFKNSQNVSSILITHVIWCGPLVARWLLRISSGTHVITRTKRWKFLKVKSTVVFHGKLSSALTFENAFQGSCDCSHQKVNILESQRATPFTLWKDCRADFWECQCRNSPKCGACW